MSEVGQALLWDGVRDEYVVVRAGDQFYRFRVTSLDPDHVVLSSNNQHFVLPRTVDTTDLRQQRDDTTSVVTASELVDPYAGQLLADQAAAATHSTAASNQAATASSVLDPYDLTTPVPVVLAPLKSRAIGPVDSSSSDLALVPQSSSPLAAKSGPTLDSSMPSPTDRGSAQSQSKTGIAHSPTSPPREQYYTVRRRDFNVAMTDFDSLGKEVQVQLTPSGVRIENLVRGSLLYRMGLRAGDIVLSVDEQRITSIDDAAAVYAKLIDADKFAAKISRDSQLLMLRYRFD